MHLLSDSKSFLDIISRSTRTCEKGIMLDIHAARQGYLTQEISSVWFARSADNLADGLAKAKIQAELLKLLKVGKHNVKFGQWIFRSKRNGADRSANAHTEHRDQLQLILTG